MTDEYEPVERTFMGWGPIVRQSQKGGQCLRHGAYASLICPGCVRENALEERIKMLEEALRDFANIQHWAVSKRFVTPEHVWIGSVHKHPSEIAREALSGGF